MFTGIVQKIGRLEALEHGRAGGRRIRVTCDPWEDALVRGESVAVQGVCLTVAEVNKNGFAADLLEETISRTNLGKKSRGDRLNLERALRPSDRVGGHFVQGHVDGVGKVIRNAKAGSDWVLELSCGTQLTGDVVVKGSVAIDGVSLTVVELGDSGFSVRLIPTTLEDTSLGKLRSGDSVNIETDILAKYARKGARADVHGEVTLEKLRETGFSV